MCKPNQLGIRSIKTHDLTKSSNTTHTFTTIYMSINRRINCDTFTKASTGARKPESISQFCLHQICHNPVRGVTNTLKQAHCKSQNMMLKPRFSRASTFYNLLLSLPLVSYLYLLIFFLNDLWCNIHPFHLVPLGSWSSNTSLFLLLCQSWVRSY